jgi:hypothetical protein
VLRQLDQHFLDRRESGSERGQSDFKIVLTRFPYRFPSRRSFSRAAAGSSLGDRIAYVVRFRLFDDGLISHALLRFILAAISLDRIAGLTGWV